MMAVFNLFVTALRVVIVFMPGIVPLIAFFIERKRGNPFCWFWLVGGLIMAAGLSLSIRHYGWQQFIAR